jgi:release factor glutamine methyltransferase
VQQNHAYQYIREQLLTVYDSDEANTISRLLVEYFLRVNFLNEAAIQKSLNLLLKHQPLQYVTGEAWFYHRCFEVNPSVLIPRPETEELVDLVYQTNKDQHPQKIVDIGTGSGCIAITLKLLFPGAQVTAIEKSADAITIAQKNALQMGAEIQFIETDFLNDTIFKWDEKFNIIISNPPYIAEREKNKMEKNVIDYEPDMALFVPDNDPLIFYKQIAKWGIFSLAENGKIFVEINQTLGPETMAVFEKEGYSASLLKDLSGNDRIISALKKG